MYRAMLGALVSGLMVIPAAMAAPHEEEFHAVFSGFNEVGAIFSPGRATLELELDRADQTLSFVLKYSGLSAPVTQSHIHFGKVHVAGGVMVFFCSNLAGAPAGTQPCPANGGTVTGTLSAGNVVGPTAQGVTVGDFQAIVEALQSDTTYANVHTTAFPAGEIRGEIRRGFHDDD
jgi:hypothetical protein